MIYVDADSCPVVDEVIELAGRAQLKVTIVHNRHHELDKNHDHVELKETGDRSDAADHFIYNNLNPDDIVITDDLGLATLVLGKDAEVIRFRGSRPTRDDIDMRLAMREASRRERQRSSRVTGPPEFTKSDRESFKKSLADLLDLN